MYIINVGRTLVLTLPQKQNGRPIGYIIYISRYILQCTMRDVLTLYRVFFISMMIRLIGSFSSCLNAVWETTTSSQNSAAIAVLITRHAHKQVMTCKICWWNSTAFFRGLGIRSVIKLRCFDCHANVWNKGRDDGYVWSGPEVTMECAKILKLQFYEIHFPLRI